MLRFAVVGIDHGHTFDHVKGLLAAGAELVGYCPKTSVPSIREMFEKTYPDAPQIDREQLLADPSIDVICIAAIPADRADLAIRAMKSGKDVMTDKPGVTTSAQLQAVKDTVAETGRIF